MLNIGKRNIAIFAAIFFLGGFYFANAQGLKNADDMTGKFAEQAGYDEPSTDDLITETIGSVIKMFLSLLGVVFLFYVIYGGWVYMTAQGAEQKVEEALKIIKTATIGLVIILAAYAISFYIFREVARGTLTNIN